MTNVLVVFLGGGIGASARYLLSTALSRTINSSFPYGTFVVNVLGCFLIGLLMSMFEERFLVNPALRMFLTIGILGGFTTFSTFSYETITLLNDAQFLYAGLNIALSIVTCLGATYVGMTLGKMV